MKDYDVHEYIELKKKLMKYKKMQSQEIIKILKILQNCQITSEILVQSQIHSILSKIAKNKDGRAEEKVSKKAKEVRKVWKIMLKTKKNQKPEKSEFQDFDEKETKRLFHHPETKELKNKQKQKKIEIPEEIFFEDKKRSNFFQKLYTKLLLHSQTQTKTKETQNLCLQIEKKLYQKSIEQKKPYIKIIRERWLILTNKEYKKIPEKLIAQKISPEDFCYKEPKDLLEDDRIDVLTKNAQDYTMKALQTDFYLKNTDYKEGEFQCWKCKGKKIITEQKQMRSADEPMTTFFTCVECNNRWKM